MVLGKLDIQMQMSKIGSLFISPMKMVSKWVKELNVKYATVKLLEENLKMKPFDIGLNNIFGMTPKAEETKAKINKWNNTKLKRFYTAKETISKIKTQPTEWEKTFAKPISDTWLISKIYKELIKLKSNKTNSSC